MSGTAASATAVTTDSDAKAVSDGTNISQTPFKQRLPGVKEEDEELVRELCLSNGINFSKLENGGMPSVERLEMFFSGYPKFVAMHLFPNLTSLTIVGQPVSKIEGISSLTKLQELWLCESEVKKIDKLEPCKLLKKLYLYSNKIHKIENLDHLTELEVLWLNSNKIENIENLCKLSRLKDLNLAENRITKIGHMLDNNQRLESLDLSGNRIASLGDLTNLMKLPFLAQLSLKNPVYPACPVSLLCNYSTHLLYHLPQLSKLDTYDVSSKSVADLARSTVLKKKMYYNMRVKTVERNMSDVMTKLRQYKLALFDSPHDRIRIMMNAVKEMEGELGMCYGDCVDPNLCVDLGIEEGQVNLQKVNENAAFVRKLTALKERLKRWERKCAEIESYYQETAFRISQKAEDLISKMVIELESGGNVRFEEGSASDVWFSSCHDLVLSRFCATDYRDYGVSGIKIHRIIRIHNRILRSHFEEKINTLVDEDDGEYFPVNRNTSYKKLLEYLFWMWDPQLPGGSKEPHRVLEEGFMDADTYKKLGGNGAVPLSNSLSLADRHRIEHLTKQTSNQEYGDQCPFRYGQITISKVYLGKSVKAIDDRIITKSNYSKIDSVFKPRKMCLMADNQSGGPNSSCECSSRQCEWYIFDNALVLPEYIVEFEYITKMRCKSQFIHFGDVLLDQNDGKAISTLPTIMYEDDKTVDSDILNMEPQIKPRPRLIALTEELLLKISKCDMLNTITTLNLHGNGLSKLKPLQALVVLKRLIVSFNELTRLDDLAHMGIEYLDASFNKITTLEGMKALHKLTILDLSWNKLQNTREELSVLRKHTPNMLTLDTRHNQWHKPDDLRLRIIGRLKSLTTLDGQSVTEAEATAALRMAAGSRISQVSLLTHSRTDNHRPRSLSLQSTAQVLTHTSRAKPEKIGDHDTHWYLKVTTLNLDNQHLTKLSGMEKLENLKWASFNNNDLTKIEGLENCCRLEELSLQGNCICRLEGVAKLTQLRRLGLGNNCIVSIENTGLQCLSNLHYLSLENNKISSLLGIQKVLTLVEFYVGNNTITNMRELFYLKVLPGLVLLDLLGNPIAEEVDNYRLFVIYHLKTLKALDGVAIEATEGNLAKDTFGGRLTPDFVAEKLGHSNFLDVRELDMPTAGIRIVDLGPGDFFTNLRSVNLEHNNLVSFSGLINLPNLRVLCLNHNHIECIIPKPKSQGKQKMPGINTITARAVDFLTAESLSPVLENLEVLHLGYNGIKDMGSLQLSRLTSLKALFLQGNEIQKIDGLHALHDLRELVLDRNKIKSISDNSFINQWNLQELHLEENRLRDLANLSCLENLHRLYMGSNRIQELVELEKLDGLMSLIEISVVNNSAARRHLHRPLLIFKLKQLMVIDGIPVTEDERAKAELYFMDQQIVSNQGTVSEGSMSGIGQYKTHIPVKVTNMQLATAPSWNGGYYYDDSGLQDIVPRGPGQRRRASKASDNGGLSLNRGQTMVYNQLSSQSHGYGGFAYTNPGNRAQFYLNQIPYVTQPTTSAEYVEWLTRMNNARNSNKR